MRFLRAHACERLLGFLGGPNPPLSGAPVRWLMARGRRASGVAAAPRSRAAGAPATRRRHAVGGACACHARSNDRRRPLVVVRTPTPNYLRLASPDNRGKYCPVCILQACGGGAIPGFALSTIKRFVAITSLLAVEAGTSNYPCALWVMRCGLQSAGARLFVYTLIYIVLFFEVGRAAVTSADSLTRGFGAAGT